MENTLIKVLVRCRHTQLYLPFLFLCNKFENISTQEIVILSNIVII